MTAHFDPPLFNDPQGKLFIENLCLEGAYISKIEIYTPPVISKKPGISHRSEVKITARHPETKSTQHVTCSMTIDHAKQTFDLLCEIARSRGSRIGGGRPN
jgi:hypothetical protein